MSNESKQLAAKAKGIDAKQVGNALLNNALIIIMLAVAAYVAITQPSFLAPRSLVNLLSLTAAYLPVALGIAGCIVQLAPTCPPAGLWVSPPVWRPPCSRPATPPTRCGPISAPCPSPWSS